MSETNDATSTVSPGTSMAVTGAATTATVAGWSQVTPSNETPPTPPSKRGRGRPKGTKLDLIDLRAGGKAGRTIPTKDDCWYLESRQKKRANQLAQDSSDEDSDYSSSVGDGTLSDKDLDVESDEEDPTCISDMQGNWVLPLKKFCCKVNEHMCCKKCAVHGMKRQFKEFFQFCEERERRKSSM